jgi:hypothetical protein
MRAGWAQIPETVQQITTFDGKRYGVPAGTDGRVLFFNKTLFARAGPPTSWQPTSWDEIVAAGQKLKAAGVPAPIQINAGTAMGEATLAGGLPRLVRRYPLDVRDRPVGRDPGLPARTAGTRDLARAARPAPDRPGRARVGGDRGVPVARDSLASTSAFCSPVCSRTTACDAFWRRKESIRVGSPTASQAPAGKGKDRLPTAPRGA